MISSFPQLGRGGLNPFGLGKGGFVSGRHGVTDPLAGLDFLFRGYGLPDGAFQDYLFTTPATEDGDPFGGWKDTNENSVYQAEMTFRGTLRNVGGSWCWRSDGVNDFFFNASPIIFDGDFSAFVKQATTGDGMLVGSAGPNQQILRIGAGGLNSLSFFDGANQFFSDTLTAARGVPNVVGITRSGSTITFWEGDNAIGTAESALPVEFSLIGIQTGATLAVNGDIYAVLIADTDMSSDVGQINAAMDLL